MVTSQTLITNIVLLFMLMNSVNMMNSSPPHSPPSSESFDWKAFLIDPPGDSTVMPDHRQVEESQREVSLSPNSEGLLKKKKKRKYPEESIEKRKIASRIRSKRFRASQKVKEEDVEINIEKKRKQVSKEKAHIYEKRYRENKKKSCGFTSVNHAKMHQLRLLEKVGQLTPEQEKKLFDHRAKNNLRTQEWRERKKSEQKADKAP